MTDVFISYSRRDSAFVRELHGFLTGAGRDAWVDWEDIAPASQWEQDIGDSIDAAESFLFVASPSSLASEECGKELRRAQEGGKRIVPLAIDGAAPEDAPPVLRQINWIWCREADDREGAYALLARALDTDRDWARVHTRLLTRAVDWDVRQDGSLLLRGKDLAEAERALAAHAGEEPRPTDLQERYLHASRRSAKRRQRTLLGGVTIALAVSIVLGVLALLQRNTAREQRDRAASIALASASDGQRARRPDVSLLLALDAYGASPTVQARSSMLSALETARRSEAKQILHGHTRGVIRLAFSKDGRTLASAGLDGTVRLWDVAGHKPLGAPLSGPSRELYGMALSPDGRTIATAGLAGVQLWDVRSHEQIADLGGHEGWVYAVAFSPDGSTLASGGIDKTVRLWNVRTHEQEGPPLATGDLALRLAFSADGDTLATTGLGKAVQLWDVGRHKRLRPALVADSDVAGVAFSPDGRTLATVGGNGDLQLWSTDGYTRTGQPLEGGGSVAFSRDGRLVASGVDRTVRIWNVRSGAPLGPPLRGHTGVVLSVAFSPDGGTLASGAADATVRLWDVRGTTPLGSPLPGSGLAFAIEGLAFSPDGNTLAAAGQNAIWRWRMPGGTALDPLGFGEGASFNSVAFSSDGGTLASAGNDGSVQLWDAGGREEPVPLEGLGGAVYGVAFSPDGNTLAAGGSDQEVRLWDVGDRKELPPVLAHEGYVQGVAFSPDGDTLASGGTDQKVVLWDVGSHEQRGPPLVGPSNPIIVAAIWAVAFSPDGRLVAGASGDDRVWLWDARSHAALEPPLTGNNADVFGVAFSPDGRMLASAGEDRTVRLWDVASHKQLGPTLRGHTGPVQAVAFSPDGRTLASGGDDGTVRLWKGLLWRDLDDLRSQVCSLVAGNLSELEWQQLVPGLTYRTACPS